MVTSVSVNIWSYLHPQKKTLQLLKKKFVQTQNNFLDGQRTSPQILKRFTVESTNSKIQSKFWRLHRNGKFSVCNCFWSYLHPQKKNLQLHRKKLYRDKITSWMGRAHWGQWALSDPFIPGAWPAPKTKPIKHLRKIKSKKENECPAFIWRQMRVQQRLHWFPSQPSQSLPHKAGAGSGMPSATPRAICHPVLPLPCSSKNRANL